MNVNPRSIYNKSKEFKEFIEMNEVDIVCMSESWERESFGVNKLLQLENFEIISNVHQRKGRGGRPLVIEKKGKYIIENLTNTILDIPWGVEIVWMSITPNSVTNKSIIVCMCHQTVTIRQFLLII